MNQTKPSPFCLIQDKDTGVPTDTVSSLFHSAASTEINTNSLEFPPFFHILAFISLSTSGKLNVLGVQKNLIIHESLPTH